MRNFLCRLKIGELFLILATLFLILPAANANAEDWKGESEASVLSVGGLTGLGLVRGSSGLVLLGTVSKKIVNRGFVPDISNSVSLEGQVGPTLFAGVTNWMYSVHLRWDFEKDRNWNLFALGGLGGNAGGNSSELAPNFGVGALWKMAGPLNIRFQLTHNLIVAGVNVPFY